MDCNELVDEWNNVESKRTESLFFVFGALAGVVGGFALQTIYDFLK